MKISVVIPTWNRADLLEKAVRSALAQTMPPFEVLVCDDGSTDNSREKIMSLGDRRVFWIDGPRGGRPAIPRNRGINESRADWVAFLDSDDEWLPEKLQRQTALLQKYQCLAVSSNAFRYISGRGIVGNVVDWQAESVTFEDLLRINHIICSSVIVHKSLFSKVVGFPENEDLIVGEDYALWLRIATQTTFAFVDEPLLIYRDNPRSSIRSEGNNVFEQKKHVLNDFRKWWSGSDVPVSYMRKVRGKLLVVWLLSTIRSLVPRRASSEEYYCR